MDSESDFGVLLDGKSQFRKVNHDLPILDGLSEEMGRVLNSMNFYSLPIEIRCWFLSFSELE